MAAVSVYKSKYKFKGGVHPQEMQPLPPVLPIKSIPLAAQLVIPLKQHIGQQNEPCVAIGDKVLKGQRIASGCAPVHSSTSGIIADIGPHPAVNQTNLLERAISITPDGKQEWIELSGITDYLSQPKDTLLDAIAKAGIVGLGGAGFPAITKLKAGQIDTIIVNAVECEPYINADNALMQTQATHIITGLSIVVHILGATKCLIGIEDDKPQALESMRDAATSSIVDTDIVVCPTLYPSGSEKLLIKLLTGKEVASGQLPSSLGMISFNVGTLHAIYKAVVLGQPLLERITSIYTDNLATSGNYNLLLGTPISHLVDHLQINSEQAQRLIIGGPMMGFTLSNLEAPVTKIVNCIMAVTNKQLPLEDDALECIKCGACSDACPVELLPQQLLWYSKAAEYSKLNQYNLFDCIECGACSYVCPSKIPLVQYYRHAKKFIHNQDTQAKQANHSKERFEFRNQRLEQEQQQRIQKRQKRLDQANSKPKTNTANTSNTLAQLNIAIAKVTEQLNKLKTETQSDSQLDVNNQLKIQLSALQIQKKQLE
jgi:Na+-translocating ferredoxin:NAD+ oxidoreductase subunit C